MILGQSAATAATLALDAGVSVQQLDYGVLAARLLADGQVLETALDGKANLDPRKLEGVVMDNPQSEQKGKWGISSSVPPMVGLNYLHDGGPDTGDAEAVYTLKPPAPGRYEVRVSYTPNPNRATNALVTVRHGDGVSEVRVNQKEDPGSHAPFHSIGVYRFDGEAVVTVSNAGADGYVIADAVQLATVKP